MSLSRIKEIVGIAVLWLMVVGSLTLFMIPAAVVAVFLTDSLLMYVAFMVAVCWGLAGFLAFVEWGLH